MSCELKTSKPTRCGISPRIQPRAAGTCPGRSRGGFSLLELMIVLVIIGLLAGLITTNVRGRLMLARQNVAKYDIATIVDALETFYTINARYPTNDEGLRVLSQATHETPEPLLEQFPEDPWDHPYEYNYPGLNHTYEVICLGGDGQEGGDGIDRDIVSWQLREK